jgi:hypothetical protein
MFLERNEVAEKWSSSSNPLLKFFLTIEETIMSYVESTRPVIGKVLFSKEPAALTFSNIGIIARVTLRGDAIMLTGGDVYLLEKGVNVKKFPIGTRVAINYENRDGLPIATSVKFLSHQFSADPRLVL